MISKRTKEIENALDAMEAMELINIFTKLEQVKQGYEDTYGVVVGGHSFQCNTHRTKNPYILDDEPTTETEFFNLQHQAYLSLVCQHGIQIIARPPHKRKPGQTGPDNIIMIPECLLGEEESK